MSNKQPFDVAGVDVTPPTCKGTNCGAKRYTDNHSEECRKEHNNTVLADMDFSDLEERVMAHMSKEKKYDGGKADISRMKRQFADALSAVALSGMYGACKYEDHNGCSYKEVSNAQDRYASAGGRHDLAYAGGELYAGDSHLHHLSAKAWNALAELQLAIENGELMIDPAWADDYKQDWERQRDELHPKVNPIDFPEEDVRSENLRSNTKSVEGALSDLLDLVEQVKEDFHL